MGVIPGQTELIEEITKIIEEDETVRYEVATTNTHKMSFSMADIDSQLAEAQAVVVALQAKKAKFLNPDNTEDKRSK